MADGRDFSAFVKEELERDPRYIQAAAEIAGAADLIDALVRARVAAGLTQTELAKRMGVRQSVISRFESGDDDTKFSTIQRYANATGHTITLSVEPVHRAFVPEPVAVQAAKAS